MSRVPPASAPKRGRRPPKLYAHALEHAFEATEFSDDPEVKDPVWLVRELKAHPEIIGPLEEILTPASSRFPGRRPRGRPRMPGSWPLVYFAFVLTCDDAMEHFWTSWRSSPLWREAGFEQLPDYDTLRLRFVEMEKLELERSERGEKTVLRRVADLLIRQARRHEPRIGEAVHVDGTAFQTNARLVHDCPDPVRCAALPQKGAKLLQRASDEEVRTHRHAEARTAEPAEGELPDGAAEDAGEDEDFKYVWLSTGHRYRIRDKTAGARLHGPGKSSKRKPKKFWVGGTLVAGVDHFLGAPLAVTNIAADKHEHHAYPDLMDEIIDALGERPLAMTGDRAQSIKSVFEYNTTRGIASAVPWRKPRADIQRADVRTDDYDEHGVMTCQYCGGPSQMESTGLGFYLDARGKPRLRYRCLLIHTEACKKQQSKPCSAEYRLLLPISRLSPYYHALRKSHSSVEKVFRHWRDRYNVAGKNADTRLKRPGLPFQQLHASAALVIEWFRICLRYGWLGSARRRELGEIRTTDGSTRLKRLLNSRHRLGLNLPRGPAAVKLGLARAGPGP